MDIFNNCGRIFVKFASMNNYSVRFILALSFIIQSCFAIAGGSLRAQNLKTHHYSQDQSSLTVQFTDQLNENEELDEDDVQDLNYAAQMLAASPQGISGQQFQSTFLKTCGPRRISPGTDRTFTGVFRI